jgi:hypothetical protein
MSTNQSQEQGLTPEELEQRFVLLRGRFTEFLEAWSAYEHVLNSEDQTGRKHLYDTYLGKWTNVSSILTWDVVAALIDAQSGEEAHKRRVADADAALLSKAGEAQAWKERADSIASNLSTLKDLKPGDAVEIYRGERFEPWRATIGQRLIPEYESRYSLTLELPRFDGGQGFLWIVQIPELLEAAVRGGATIQKAAAEGTEVRER